MVPAGVLCATIFAKKDNFLGGFGIFRGGIWPPKQLRFGVGSPSPLVQSTNR